MICPKCGEELEDGSTECFLCGYNFETEDSINNIDEKTELKNNPNKKNTAIVMTILVFFIVAVVVVSILSKYNKKKSNN